MSADRQAVADATYALFALEQPISLIELAAAARESTFPLAATQTPGWFAAAADDDYSLLETAPELLVLPTDLASAERIDVSGIDLIHVYAPELAENAVTASAVPVAVSTPSADTAAVTPAELPSTSTQLGLLKELSNLDV